MHRIRSKARHLAYQSDIGGVFNPFRKLNRTKTGTGTFPEPLPETPEQHEQRLARLHSESCLETESESIQREENAHTLRHPATAPAASPTSGSPNSDFVSTSETRDIGKQDEEAPVAGDNNAEDSKPRHRGQKMFHKGDDDPEKQATKTSESKTKKHFGVWEQVRTVICGSWINVLLICAPLGIAIHYAKVNPYADFVINFVAIMPLAGILSYSTEEIALRVGETLGGLLNASFGNAVELIVAIIALAQKNITIVQTSLIGSMLSNLLLVLGMCFFFGGVNRYQQYFNVTVAQTAASLLALSVGSLIIPTVYGQWGSTSSQAYRSSHVASLSRGTSVVLLFVYASYLFFQLKSHIEIYNAPSQKSQKRRKSKDKTGEFKNKMVSLGANSAAALGGEGFANPEAWIGHPDDTDDDEAEEPRLSIIGAVVSLCIATALIGICAEFMVSGIGEIVQKAHISPEFIGLILIPIVGNAAEHVTAVTVAIKDKMDLAIGVAVGSSMQISLLVLPLVVVIGWIMNVPMTLEFDGFLIALLFVSVLLVNYLIGDGSSHWLEGVMLMSIYVIIAVAAYLYPATDAVVG